MNAKQSTAINGVKLVRAGTEPLFNSPKCVAKGKLYIFKPVIDVAPLPQADVLPEFSLATSKSEAILVESIKPISCLVEQSAFSEFEELPKVSLAWAVAKRVADFVGSAFLLLLLSPVFVVVSLLIAKTGGVAVFGHRRLGRGGRWFTCYKFRTMVPNAQEALKKVLAQNPALQAEWMRDEKLRDDPRITRIGKFLRRTSMDELPQLFNVLVGDMSLVGPRPVTEEGVGHYSKALRWYLAVRPGMTGLWQVSGRNRVGFRRRVALDTCYVRNQSFMLDLQILIRTFRVVLRGDGC